MLGATFPLPQYAFMSCCSVKSQGQLIRPTLRSCLKLYKGEGVSKNHGMEMYSGCRCKTPCISHLTKKSVQLQAPAALTPKETHRYPLAMRLDGLQSVWKRWSRKKSDPLWNRTPFVQPVASQSTYWDIHSQAEHTIIILILHSSNANSRNVTCHIKREFKSFFFSFCIVISFFSFEIKSYNYV